MTAFLVTIQQLDRPSFTLPWIGSDAAAVSQAAQMRFGATDPVGVSVKTAKGNS